MVRKCPNCATPLKRKDFDGLVLDTCPTCAGVFFDEGELADLRGRGEHMMATVDDEIQPEAAGSVAPASEKSCPGCGAKMGQFRYLYSSPVILDSCDQCGGVWIENGELKQMHHYLHTHSKGSGPVVAEVRGIAGASG